MELHSRISGLFDNCVIVKKEPLETVEEEAGYVCHTQQWEEGNSSCTYESTALLDRWSDSAERSGLKPEACVTTEAGLRLGNCVKTGVVKLEAGVKSENYVNLENDVRPENVVGPEHGVGQKPGRDHRPQTGVGPETGVEQEIHVNPDAGVKAGNDVRSENGICNNWYVMHTKPMVIMESSELKAAVCDCHLTDSKHNHGDGLSFVNDPPPRQSGVMLTDQQECLPDGDHFQIKLEVPSEEEVQRGKEEAVKDRLKRGSEAEVRPNGCDGGGRNPGVKEEVGHEEGWNQWQQEDSVVIRLNDCGDNGSGNVINMHPNDSVLSFPAPSSSYTFSTDGGWTCNRSAPSISSMNHGSSCFGLVGPSNGNTNVAFQSTAFESTADQKAKQECGFNACAGFGSSVSSVEEDRGVYFGRSRRRLGCSQIKSKKSCPEPERLILMTRDPQRNDVVVCNFNMNTGQIVRREIYACCTDQQMQGTREASPKKTQQRKTKVEKAGNTCFDVDCTKTTAAVANSTNGGRWKQRSAVNKVRRKRKNSSVHNSKGDTSSTVFANSAADSSSPTTAVGDSTPCNRGCPAQEGKEAGRRKRSKKGLTHNTKGDNSSAVSLKVGRTCSVVLTDIATLGIGHYKTSTRTNSTISSHAGIVDNNTAVTGCVAISANNSFSQGPVRHGAGPPRSDGDTAGSAIANNGLGNSIPMSGKCATAADSKPSPTRPVRLLYSDVAVRSSSGKTMFKCPHCGRLFAVIPKFNRHIVRQHPTQVC